MRGVDRVGTTFNVAVKVDAEKLYGVQFELTYDPNFLTLQDAME